MIEAVSIRMRKVLTGAALAAVAGAGLLQAACLGPPTITCGAAPTTLTPADGTLRPVTVTVDATTPSLANNTPSQSAFTLTRVTSNEAIAPADYPGFTPGTTYPPGTSSVSGQLRAAVAAGSHGRTYQLSFQASNKDGSSTCTTSVQVRLR